MKFEKELQTLINRCNIENESNTPDFILAQYIRNCLNAFNKACNSREKWYGREQVEVEPPYNVEERVSCEATNTYKFPKTEQSEKQEVRNLENPCEETSYFVKERLKIE